MWHRADWNQLDKKFTMFWDFLNFGKIYVFVILTILSAQFSSIKYIYIVVQLHNHPSLELIRLPKLKPCSWQIIIPHYFPPSPWQLPFYHLSPWTWLFVCGTSYKQNHTVLVLLWLPYLTLPTVFEVHPCCSMYQGFLSFFFFLEYPVAYRHTALCLSTYLSTDTWVASTFWLCCYKHGCTNISSNPCFQLFWKFTQK